MFTMDDQSTEIPEEDESDLEDSVLNNETESLEVAESPEEIEATSVEEEVVSDVEEKNQLPQTTISDEDIADNPFVNAGDVQSEPEPVISESILAGIEEKVAKAEKKDLSENLFIKAEAKLKAEKEAAEKIKAREKAKAESEYAGVDFNVGEEESEDDRAWYVVHCYSGYENKVRHNLEQRIETMNMKDFIFDVVVPVEEEIEVKDGKRRSVERRVFPGYILVNMEMNEESWYVVRNTPGVTSFVGMGNDPIPLRKDEVAKIMKRMEADAPRIKVTFRQGERVRIVDGPFNDFRGTVAEIDMDKAKVRVMVNFFGRETPVELDFLQVEKA